MLKKHKKVLKLFEVLFNKKPQADISGSF